MAINVSDSGSVSPDFFSALQQRLEKYLPDSSETVRFFLESPALLHTTTASLRSFAYVFYAKELGVNNPQHFLSSRVAFLESGILCLVSAVHYLALGLFYSTLVFFSLGQSSSLNLACRGFWSQVGYSFTCAGIGGVGAFSPTKGCYLHHRFLASTWMWLKGDFKREVILSERELILSFKSLFARFRSTIYSTARTVFQDRRFQLEFEPTLRYAEKSLSQIERMEELLALINEIWNRIPDNTVQRTEEELAAIDALDVDLKQGKLSLADLIASLQNHIEINLPDSTTRGWILLQSMPLWQLFTASLKNAPYVLFSSELGINSFSQFFVSRANFFEASLLSAASFAHNVMMACLYAGLFALTLGQSRSIHFALKRHVSHIGHAAMGTVIGITGAVIPYFGMGLTYLFFSARLKDIQHDFKRDLRLHEPNLIRGIKRVFQRFRPVIYLTFKRTFSPERYRDEFRPSIVQIEQAVEKMKKGQDLIALVLDFWARFPHMGDVEGARRNFINTRPTAGKHYYDYV